MRNLRITATLLLVVGLTLNAQAQSKSEKPKEGEIKVVVIKNENGNVSKIDEKFTWEEEEKLHELLNEHGVDIDLNNSSQERGIKLDHSGVSKDKNMIVKVKVKEESDGNVKEDVKVLKFVSKESNIEVDDERSTQVKKAIEEGDMETLIELVGKDKSKMMFINEEDMDLEIDSDGNKVMTKSFEMYTTKDGNKVGTMVFIKSESEEVDIENLPTEIKESFDDESSLQDLNLYPNPANNNFKMSFNSKEAKDYQLSIIDTKGSIIYEKLLNDFKGQFNEDFDLSKYDNGIYFFNLSTDDEKISKKIVVQ